MEKQRNSNGLEASAVKPCRLEFAQSPSNKAKLFSSSKKSNIRFSLALRASTVKNKDQVFDGSEFLQSEVEADPEEEDEGHMDFDLAEEVDISLKSYRDKNN